MTRKQHESIWSDDERAESRSRFLWTCDSASSGKWSVVDREHIRQSVGNSAALALCEAASAAFSLAEELDRQSRTASNDIERMRAAVNCKERTADGHAFLRAARTLAGKRGGVRTERSATEYRTSPVVRGARIVGARGTIQGYGAVFYQRGNKGTEYALGPGIIERIGRQAFDAPLKRGDDVRGLFNHDANLVLGRTASGTMRLSVDDVGLKFEIDNAGHDVFERVSSYVQRGDVTGSSFSFVVDAESWSREGDVVVRNVESVTLFDVGPVTFPAYQATTAQIA